MRKPKVNKTALNLLLLFLLTQELSLIGAANIGAGLVRLEQYGLAGAFGLFLASQDYQGLLRKDYLPLVLAIIGESIVAILQFINGGTLGLWFLGERTFSISTPSIAKFDFFGWQFLRPYATFPHPNVLAGFVLIGICILSPALRERRKITSLVVALGSAVVLVTMSRVVIFVGLAVSVSLIRKNWLWLVVTIILIFSPILFTRFSSLFNFDNLTLLRREELIGSAWQVFLKHPILGVGLNNFIPTVASDLTIGPSRFLQPVHNILLLILSETGVIGLIGVIGVIGYPIRKILDLKFQILKILPWLIIIFLGMFDHYFLTLPQGYRLFFLVWGLSFSMLK